MKAAIKHNIPATLVTSVNLKPSEDQLLILTHDLYYAIDALISADGFTGENIMKPRGEGFLSWDWTVVSVGTYSIPAPIHTSSPGMSTLYRWNDDPVQLSNEECAYVTAIFYLDMLYRIAQDWNQVSRSIPLIARGLLQGGVEWMVNIGESEYHKIVVSMKDQLSGKGFMILD